MDSYFEWLISQIDTQDDIDISNYSKILEVLYEFNFYYDNIYDENRAVDGINLRYHYLEYKNIDRGVTYNKDFPCSMLEMMISLSLKIEAIKDDGYENRTGLWFFEMLESLGLISMTDEHFDHDKAIYILSRFVEREYEPNGEGGLFYIPGYYKDLRTMELWKQAMIFLNNY